MFLELWYIMVETDQAFNEDFNLSTTTLQHTPELVSLYSIPQTAGK